FVAHIEPPVAEPLVDDDVPEGVTVDLDAVDRLRGDADILLPALLCVNRIAGVACPQAGAVRQRPDFGGRQKQDRQKDGLREHDSRNLTDRPRRAQSSPCPSRHPCYTGARPAARRAWRNW